MSRSAPSGVIAGDERLHRIRPDLTSDRAGQCRAVPGDVSGVAPDRRIRMDRHGFDRRLSKL